MSTWLSCLLQFFVVLPAAESCYYTMKNQLRYSGHRTTILCLVFVTLYALMCAWICAAFRVVPDAILIPSLVPLFMLYRHTVTVSLPKCLAVYIGVCAMQSFPGQFAYAFDAFLHPQSGAGNLSPEAAGLQLTLSIAMAAAFAWPARHYFSRIVDRVDSPKIWYSTIALSSMFLAFNVLSVPISYRTLHTGRIPYLFPLLEGGALTVLVSIYLLFYWGTQSVIERTDLQERTHLLEMQARQYRTLREYVRQTSRLRHDFRHSVRLMASLAERGDIESIRAHLGEYESALSDSAPSNYCGNAALNALFSYYHEVSASEGIRTEWRIALPDPLPVNELDLVSMFGNILDNAIDGCRTAPEDNRFFFLTVEERGPALFIVSTNSFNGVVRRNTSGFSSTKHAGRGTGLAAILATAEKYGGSAKASADGSKFFIDIMLRL